MKPLDKYSIGIGDRFGHQGSAQLAAVIEARKHHIHITPVWNKSFREHQIIGTRPGETRSEADKAVLAQGWTGDYFVDADHINMSNVDHFIEPCDFFTIDVADAIGREGSPEILSAFCDNLSGLAGEISVPGIDTPFHVTEKTIRDAASRYAAAIGEAGRIYHHLCKYKTGPFAVEVSMDETDIPQSPVELLLILKAVSDAGIEAQTVAPRFSGRFNKGVDYAGEVSRFAGEFMADMAVIEYARKAFHLPDTLKLSVHSGSDKFSIYPAMREAMRTFDAGIHLKTAGTTWLEEMIGLAEAGGEGLQMARTIYVTAFERRSELEGPYAPVIDIDPAMLPEPSEIRGWDSRSFVAALRHDPGNPSYNPHFRQLLHIGYKVAAEMKDRFYPALDRYSDIIAQNVTENLFKRHIKPLFTG